MRAVYGGLRSHTTLQAKREMVLGAMEGSSPSFPPPEVSVTTKSMGLSVERPICGGQRREQLVIFKFGIAIFNNSIYNSFSLKDLNSFILEWFRWKSSPNLLEAK